MTVKIQLELSDGQYEVLHRIATFEGRSVEDYCLCCTKMLLETDISEYLHAFPEQKQLLLSKIG